MSNNLINRENQANGYHLPPIDLLNDYEPTGVAVTEEELCTKKDKIVEVLNDNNMLFSKIIATVGPTVTLFEICPENISINKIQELDDVFAESLNVQSVRIIAPIYERGTIGIEVPNNHPKTVALRSLIASRRFQELDGELPVTIGQTIDNGTFVFDFEKAHRLNLSGDDNQGKTAALNTILASLLYRKNPTQLKLVLIDTKGTELLPYKLLSKGFLAQRTNVNDTVITDKQKSVDTLISVCAETKKREKMLMKAGGLNYREYCNKLADGQFNTTDGYEYLPYIVVVINGLNELKEFIGRKKFENLINELELSYFVGIHLIFTTQDINQISLPGKEIVFHQNYDDVNANLKEFEKQHLIINPSNCDSKPPHNSKRNDNTYPLIGCGDALIKRNNCDLVRVQCATVDIAEIERIVEFVTNQPCSGQAYILPTEMLWTSYLQRPFPKN